MTQLRERTANTNARDHLRRILYLPMEIASREMDSRLLLAAIALERGFDIVLGQKWLIERNLDAMPPGLYLSKTLTQRDGRIMERARERGSIIAAIDEEVPGLVAKPDELRWVSDEGVANADFIFVGGENNVGAYRSRFPQAAEKIVPCLNPRWDLLKPGLREIYRREASRIRERFGRFILINTNLGFSNSEKGPTESIVEEQARTGKLDLANPTVRDYVDQVIRMERANFAAIREIVRHVLTDIPNVSVVLRPHPSERIDTWQNAIGSSPRLTIIREGASIPWIIAADALVHTNCTTGVEAIALGQPALCVLATDEPVNRRYLANRVNPVARSAQEALDVLKRHVGGTDRISFSREMFDFFATSMSFDEHKLGAVTIIERLIEEFEQRGAASRGGAGSDERSHWSPGRNYKWIMRDKNVRGTLFPGFSHQVLAARLAEVARQTGIRINPRTYACGSKVALITERNAPMSVRMRQFIMKNVA